MKQLFFVLTSTKSSISKMITIYTKDEFSHSSIAFDKELQQMYSFARLNPYIAIIGGFIHEYIDKGTFKRFNNTKCEILALDVEDEKYDKLKEIVLNFEKEKKKYKFNILGLIGAGFNKRVKRKNYYYCTEFIKEVTEQADINLNLPEITRPDYFKKTPGMKVIYKGYLREYKPNI